MMRRHCLKRTSARCIKWCATILDEATSFLRRGRASALITKGSPSGTPEFKGRAWKLANDKARELGWIV
jgi:hypothetical protein